MFERTEKEFKELTEKYDIPEEMKFNLRTLLKLQEEYDCLIPTECNAKYREKLLGMIYKVQRDVWFKDKKKNNIYVDPGVESTKVYLNNEVTVIKERKWDEVWNAIASIIDLTLYNVCIDCNGLGKGLADYIESQGYKVNKLRFMHYNFNK